MGLSEKWCFLRFQEDAKGFRGVSEAPRGYKSYFNKLTSSSDRLEEFPRQVHDFHNGFRGVSRHFSGLQEVSGSPSEVFEEGSYGD